MRDAIVRFNKALANEERMEIIRLLLEHKVLYAKEVQKHFYLEQSTASHHLNILKKAKGKVMKINEVVNQSLTQEQILLQENTLFRQVADWWAKTKDRLGYETPTADTIKLDKKIKHNDKLTSSQDSIVGHLV